MRRKQQIAFAAAAAALLLACILHGGCQGDREKQVTADFHVGLVFDVGGIGDKSFNDSAYQGLMRAKKELGVSFEYIEPTAASDREAALRLLAEGPAQIIFGVGFLFTDHIRQVANEYPEKRFVCIDYSWQEGDTLPANLAGIKFREEEGSFLVGAIAGVLSETGTVGFVGGMDIPLIHKFEAGYRAGVAQVRPQARVLVNYAGVTGDAFKNPGKGKELALAQYEAGADIIYHASGSTGLGVFEAAREKGKLAIGVDSDQSEEAPGHVVTSMLKRVDVAVFETIHEAEEGRFRGGVRIMGLKEGAVDYVVNDGNRKWLTAELLEEVKELRRQIVEGQIAVPVE